MSSTGLLRPFYNRRHALHPIFFLVKADEGGPRRKHGAMLVLAGAKIVVMGLDFAAAERQREKTGEVFHD